MNKEDLDFIEKCDSGIIFAKKGEESFVYRLGNKDELITNIATLLATIEQEEWLTLNEMLEAIYLVRTIKDKENE